MVISGIRKYLFEIIGKADADELVCFVTGKTKTEMLCSGNEQITKEQEDLLKKYANEISNGRPLQYILGKWEFCGLEIEVNENVLIPRSDTELLALTAEKYICDNADVLDLCTGSGCIACFLASLKKKPFVTAADISDKALETAKRNLEKLSDGNFEIIKADALKTPAFNKKFDLIVSNPPYIKTDEIAELDENVKNEPVIALDGGKDGLKFYRSISKEWKKLLADGGKLMFEIGFDQADSVKEILCENGFSEIEIHKDLNGKDRVIIGTYTP